MAANHRRRFVRFSLRTLLVVLTLVAGFLSIQVNRANHQRAVVRWLAENNASVSYDWQFYERADGVKLFIGDSGNQPPGPIWLRRQIGDEYFQSVIGIDASVGDVSQLAGLTELEWLTLRETPVSDITPLARLKRLERLNLIDTQVRNLSPLSGLSNLEGLHLIGSPVTDLSPLSKLTKLEEISLGDTLVRDLSPLASLPDLRILHLDGTQATDLQAQLRDLTTLTDLRIHDPSFSNDQLRALQRALPNCRVSR